MTDDFKTWAIVEIMGHAEYAGFVSAETIAGHAMLRIDVPETSVYPAFTKYVAPNALYGISPCSEETARARAAEKRSMPFNSWGVERIVMEGLKNKGLLLEDRREDKDEDEDEEYFS